MAITARVGQRNKQGNFTSRCSVKGFRAKCFTAAVCWLLFDTVLYSHPVLYKQNPRCVRARVCMCTQV